MTKRSAEIAQATQELIIESGGTLPTVRQIAARSFLSPAAIYVHFPNFEAIVEDVRCTALQSLRQSIGAAKPSTLGEALGPAAVWMVENPALLMACTTPTSAGVSQGCVDTVKEALAEIVGVGDLVGATDDVVVLAFRLIAPIASLVVDNGFGATEVEQYLEALAGPIGVVASRSAVEVIRA